MMARDEEPVRASAGHRLRFLPSTWLRRCGDRSASVSLSASSTHGIPYHLVLHALFPGASGFEPHHLDIPGSAEHSLIRRAPR